MSPPLALAYFVWTRHRLALSLLAVYWLALSFLCRMLSDDPVAAEPLVFWFSAPCIIALAFLLVMFSCSRESRLEGRESGFPSSLWHLPLPTYALVGWPMFWGCAALALAWLTLSWGALRPALRPYGVEPPLGWPAMTLAVALAWLQAMIWTPFPLPGLRLVVMIPLISSLAALVPLAEAYDFPPAIGYGLLLTLLSAAYGVAVVGVARARRGDGPYWRWPGWSAWLRWISSTRARPDFGSPRQAQVWFEWRRGGLGFPVMMLACSLPWLPLIPTIAGFYDDAHRAGLVLVPPFLLSEVGSLWLVASGPLIVAPLLGSVCGWEMGRLPGPKRTLVLSSFLATRPLSTWTLVRAKLEAAALSTLAGWGVASVGILLWIALGGHAAEMADSISAFRARHPSGLLWIGLALLICGAIVLTWLQIVQGLWMGLAGSAWTKAAAALGFTFVVSLMFLGLWLAKSPRHWQRLSDLLPWLTGATLLLKGLLALYVSGLLVRRGLVKPNIIQGILAAWALFAAALLALLYWLLPSDRVSLFALVLAILLAVPLTRLLLAPLALGWNRHR